MLDAMTDSSAPVVLAAVGVNGPEGGFLDWDAVDWRSCEENVRRLRQRIFTASRNGDLKRVRSLQKLMLRSWSNTLISVRQVTQHNAGRRTAGVDGETVLDSPARAELAARIHRPSQPWRALPVRRVFIPKAREHEGPEDEGSRRGHAASAGDPGDRRPGPAGAGAARVGAGVGSPVRAPLVWVPTGPGLSGRHPDDLHYAARPEGQAGVGAGRGPGGGVRQDRARPAAGRSSGLPRRGDDPGLADGPGCSTGAGSPRPRRAPLKVA